MKEIFNEYGGLMIGISGAAVIFIMIANIFLCNNSLFADFICRWEEGGFI